MTNVSLKINEIFFSIQDESVFAGNASVFIRTSAGRVRCRWSEVLAENWRGQPWDIDKIVAEVRKYDTQRVCIIGGDSLGQHGTLSLLQRLLRENYLVCLETSGTYSVKSVPRPVAKTITIRCSEDNLRETLAWENFSLAQAGDQFKFVVASREEFQWSQSVCAEYELHEKCVVLYAPALGKVKPDEIAHWIVSEFEELPNISEAASRELPTQDL